MAAVTVRHYPHLVAPSLNSRFPVEVLVAGLVVSFHPKRPGLQVSVHLGAEYDILPITVSLRKGTFRSDDGCDSSSDNTFTHSAIGGAHPAIIISAVVGDVVKTGGKRAGSAPDGRWLATKDGQLTVKSTQTYLLSSTGPFTAAFHLERQRLLAEHVQESGDNGPPWSPSALLRSITFPFAAEGERNGWQSVSQLSSTAVCPSSVAQWPLQQGSDVHDDQRGGGEMVADSALPGSTHHSDQYGLLDIDNKETAPVTHTMSNDSLLLDDGSRAPTPDTLFRQQHPDALSATMSPHPNHNVEPRHHVLTVGQFFVLLVPKPALPPPTKQDVAQLRQHIEQYQVLQQVKRQRRQ